MIKNISNIKNIYNGRVLKLSVADVEMSNGNKTTREFVNRHETATIIATTECNEIILIEQFRYGIGNILELPSGRIERNEVPIEAALREFKEETGYKTNCIYKLNEYYTTPGFSDEKVHLFRASDLIEGEQELDENEDIKVIKMPIAELKNYVLDNAIVDSKLIVALAFLH